jgi:hypothetical protein
MILYILLILLCGGLVVRQGVYYRRKWIASHGIKGQPVWEDPHGPNLSWDGQRKDHDGVPPGFGTRPHRPRRAGSTVLGDAPVDGPVGDDDGVVIGPAARRGQH